MKKLFAIILALSMIAAMLPAGTALAADEETEKYEFIFAKEAFGYTTTQSEQIYVNTSGFTSIKSGNKWKVVNRLGGMAKASAYLHKKNSFLQFGTSSENGTYTGTDDAHDNALLIEIQLRDTDGTAATDGVYVPTVENEQHRKQTYFGIVDLYLVATSDVSKYGWNVDEINNVTVEDVNTILTKVPKLGDTSWTPTSDVLHFYSANQTKNATDNVLTADRLELTGGNYYLIATIEKPKEWEIATGSSATDNKVFGAFSNITFTREADDSDLTKAFAAKEESHTAAKKNVYAYKSTDTENTIMKSEDVTTDTVNVSTTDTEDFLYWAQGLKDEKKILSFESSFEYTPSEGNNYLVAVYRDSSVDKAEFFNANGQREAVLLADDTAPALPERVGYEPATAWVDLDGKKVAPGENVKVSGYNSYVPDYGERISVTVNGTSYNYGDPVTLSCTDDAYYQEGKYFKGWKKDDVIVSTDASYSFLAYKNTTVTAEWANEPFNFSGSGRKIVLDAFNNALMAEFIGFGDGVVEKGIMFKDTTGTRNIAMTTDSSQFVIIPDKAGTYEGYAIVEDTDGAQTLVTDGEYTKAAE